MAVRPIPPLYKDWESDREMQAQLDRIRAPSCSKKPPMSHTCSALIIHCMDFRLGPHISSWLESQGLLGDCDIVGFAGAAKNFTDESTRDNLLKHIELSVSLHSITKVILMNHTDCGAYGGRSAFASREEEDDAHKSALQEGERVISEKWPQLDVELKIAQVEPDGSVHIENA